MKSVFFMKILPNIFWQCNILYRALQEKNFPLYSNKMKWKNNRKYNSFNQICPFYIYRFILELSRQILNFFLFKSRLMSSRLFSLLRTDSLKNLHLIGEIKTDYDEATIAYEYFIPCKFFKLTLAGAHSLESEWLQVFPGF